MKYMLLINQGETPTWDARVGQPLRGRADAVPADYQAVNATPGVTPGAWMEPPSWRRR